MRANSNFKLSKTAKRIMASCADPVKSNHIKKMFIEAELAAAVQPRTPKRREAPSE